MEENKQTPKQEAAPQNYSRYMGTLNRIYGRGNNPRARKLGDGISSLKKGGSPGQQEQPANGKKDRSFQLVMGAVVAVCALYWAMNTVMQLF